MNAASDLPPLALLAGGKATRLGQIAATLPKSMVEVAGVPFLDHQLRLFRVLGVRRIVLCIGHLGHVIEAFAGDGSRYGLEIAYSRDGDRALGTGGAVRAALPLLGQTFVTCYGDSYVDTPLGPVVEAFRASGCPALMTVLHNRGLWDTSNVVFEDGRILAHDKSISGAPGVDWVDYGISVFDAGVFAALPADEPIDLSTLTRGLAQEGRLAGFEVTRRFYEIGRPESLKETEAYIQVNATAGER